MILTDLLKTKRNWLLVAILVSTAALFFFVQNRRSRFQDAVQQAGGQYFQSVPNSRSGFFGAIQGAFRRLSGRDTPVPDLVVFREGGVDDDWLVRHQDELASLKRLTLVLEDCQLTSRGIRIIGQLPDLISLDLSGVALDDELFSELLVCPTLAALDISRTGLSGDSLSALAQHPELYALAIDASQATEAGIAHLGNIPHLVSLVVFGADNDVVRRFAKIGKVQSIAFHEAAFSSDSIPDLKRLPGISLISFTERDLTEEHLREFRRAVPGCIVQHITADEVEDMKKSGL